MKIAIVGLGLIGGSLALDLRRLGHTLLGTSRRPETCEQAVALGVVDHASPDLLDMAEADVIVLCPPIEAIAPIAERLIPHLTSSTILTDVGSVKQPIVERISPQWPNFVGGHPMAGTAEQGLEAAQRDLFVGRPYVLTPTESTPQESVETMMEVVRSLQSTIHICDPAEHDRAVAWISHLPVMVSAALIAACTGEVDANVRELAQALASSGFKDTSRVGGGNPELGLMMAQHNTAALLAALTQYRTQLDRCIANIQNSNWVELEAWLVQTQQERPKYIKP
ncbi:MULTISPECIES: prephenate/arogenate dehydrogenase [unclassified Leptolyngbya]|uniref:prephenate/arogenate dehydrogenase n=1 Tax=unclassified Leptolyngbya TaxID=2650499 RepID=UPI001689EC62|nr:MULTISPECIES: prephenate/arogenate dehydrogenase [unclassified Leptolyngbya]MBD1910088.1 prephenate/arogenate dehydrogenase [Leptolyngbya sp. FACHB-8]MBD2158760.1 prephenate/arogenate dehydrogenase [Leptolyngbya sp. FACHB-16]